MVAEATAPRRENVPRHILFFICLPISISIKIAEYHA